MRHFARYGFEGASLQAIAEEVGTSKQALIYHFKSKEGLREAVIEDMVRGWNEELPRLMTALTRREVPFEEALSTVFVRLLEKPERARFVIQERLRRTGAESVQGPLTAFWLELATELVRSGQREGTVAPEVDAEMWSISLADLIVNAFAFTDPKANARWRSRRLKEVARIVGTSLHPAR
ncbi:MAG: TetR/AcrR family transcriptional regulator [Myxococcaceae bacterium]|nr:TetR/AcrR family transcriptional regulator [Myxococcaceae bacterium]MCI0670836.1 TetR/AcrR family transcriptional regulator [Myxococcaceae bacterium]